jgi:hypothetical protein
MLSLGSDAWQSESVLRDQLEHTQQSGSTQATLGFGEVGRGWCSTSGEPFSFGIIDTANGYASLC